MKPTVLFLFVFLYTFQAWAQRQNEPSSAQLAPADSLQQTDSSPLADDIRRSLHPLVRKSTKPGMLIRWGLTHMDNEGLIEGSEGIRDVVQRNYPNFNTTIDDHTAFAPVLMAVDLNLAEVEYLKKL